jgi:hypothetical protein
MQLVELETHGGEKFWVNPQQVTNIIPMKGASQSHTNVYLVGSSQQGISVKGTVADIAKKINDALKA